MNKTELIAAVAENAGLTKKDSERVVNAAIDAITSALAVEAHAFSKAAQAAIEAAGGSISKIEK